MTTALTLVIGAAGAVFALFAWLVARERQPFRLSEKREGLALLTRTKRPTVQLHEVFVFGVRTIITQDRAALVKHRLLPRDRSLVLAVQDIPVGELVAVRYRRVWPWDAFAHHPRLPGWLRKRLFSQARRDRKERSLEADRDQTSWTYWHGHLL
ncbi:hypothetical protein AXA44_37880 [Rhodococcus sp. SC4]|nr:hypothetical protein AXA44_37880 [Rhodococcus sp. SC4]